MYNKSITKFNSIDTNDFVIKNQYYTDKSALEKKIDDTSKKISDASEAYYNTKISEIEGKRSSITGLANTAALNTVKNRIPEVSNRVKKADYDGRIS